MGTLKNLFGSGKKPETLYANGKGDQKLFAGKRKNVEDNQITAPKDPRKNRLSEFDSTKTFGVMPRSLSESEKKNLANYEKMLEIKRLNNETEEEKQVKYHAIQKDYSEKYNIVDRFNYNLDVQLTRQDNLDFFSRYQTYIEKNTLSPFISDRNGKIIGFVKRDDTVKIEGMPDTEVYLDITPCVYKEERGKGLEFVALQEYLSQPYTGISYHYEDDSWGEPGRRLFEKIDNKHPELVEVYDAKVTVADDNPKFVAELIRDGWTPKEDVSLRLHNFSVFEKKVPVVKAKVAVEDDFNFGSRGKGLNVDK